LYRGPQDLLYLSSWDQLEGASRLRLHGRRSLAMAWP